MYVIKDNVLKISVRNLVEFIFRSGDIDSGTGTVADIRAMQEGARLHRKIQKSMGGSYKAEVPLKLEIPIEGAVSYKILIEGRADGVICDLTEGESATDFLQTGVVIDEIKTIHSQPEKLDGPVYVHKAQAMAYAYIYALQNNLPDISVQLTYCNAQTEEIRQFREYFLFEQIKRWFDDMISAFRIWTDFVFKHQEIRQESILKLEFPYEYRKGQKSLVVNVYRSIQNERNLYIQAPTGVGKTLSTVFPSVMAMGQAYADKIFYLTSKTITRRVAEDTFEILRNKGLQFKTVTITARDKICCMEERQCTPKDCIYAKGHYDRINDAVYDVITHNCVVDRKCIEKYAELHKVCPYELSLDVSYWCDGIICDYNYVFDPDVALKRYFSDGNKGDYIFLVDEAHNLVDRARQMYSAQLVKEDFLKAKNIVKDTDKHLAASFERCNKDFLALKKECPAGKVLENTGRLTLHLEQVYSKVQEFFEKYKDFLEKKDKADLLEIYFKIRHFLNMYDCMDGDYVIYTGYTVSNEFLIKLYCVNPSKNISSRLNQAGSTIFFSATLLPVNYFKEMLSGNAEEYAVYAESSFNPDNKCVLVAKDVSSRYKRRGESEYKKICRYISDVIRCHAGKYMVFFPSYTFMQSVFDMFMTLEECKATELKLSCSAGQDIKMGLKESRSGVGGVYITGGQDIKTRFKESCDNSGNSIYIVRQSAAMREEDKEEFLKLFEALECSGSLVGFCVNGGVFSEGIDLKNDSLIGVIVVGTGLPMICRERDILKNYFDEHDRDGYSYAYVYPGMNKVLQAAGRVIRTSEDTGVITLLDDRFLTAEYRQLYPREWTEVNAVTKENVSNYIKRFWNK